MSFKNILIRSVATAVVSLSATFSANANLQYSLGLGYGLGIFKFNENMSDLMWSGSTISSPVFTTTYKYIDNLPQDIIHLEVGIIKQFENIRLADRSFFAGATFGFGGGKTFNSKVFGSTTVKYPNTGSTALFWSLNGKFGLENKFSKIYAITGFTMAKVDVPYNIPGSLNGTPINDLVKVSDVNFSTFLINLGLGTEVNMTERLTIFAEYARLLQLDGNKEPSVNYSFMGQDGKFTGKIKAGKTEYIKAGLRYYFG